MKEIGASQASTNGGEPNHDLLLSPISPTKGADRRSRFHFRRLATSSTDQEDHLK